ncbi:hypothetical protein [Rufibacter roseus]|uniref:DUF4367 domain-containing protein n=1 Tax=Rufibacter roseus TaxID=1567108 RepID=A0ABW2DQA1_9BACT|nr:hypothetical protein [Rufibacter roseus]
MNANNILLISALILFCSCDWGRTPSKNRFQTAADIIIPTDIQIIQDEYQDMWQDYAIIYKIGLTPASTTQLIKSIHKSKYYDPVKAKSSILKAGSESYNGVSGEWLDSEDGYLFQGKEGRTFFSIELDTVNREAIFKELAD